MIEFDSEKILVDIVILKAKVDALEEMFLTDKKQVLEFNKFISEKTIKIMKETYGIDLQSDDSGKLTLPKNQ